MRTCVVTYEANGFVSDVCFDDGTPGEACAIMFAALRSRGARLLPNVLGMVMPDGVSIVAEVR